MNCDSGVLEPQICFAVGENFRKQVLPKNLNATYPRKKEGQIEDLRNCESKPKLKI